MFLFPPFFSFSFSFSSFFLSCIDWLGSLEEICVATGIEKQELWETRNCTTWLGTGKWGNWELGTIKDTGFLLLLYFFWGASTVRIRGIEKGSWVN